MRQRTRRYAGAALSLAMLIAASRAVSAAMRFDAPSFYRFTIGADGEEIGRYAAIVDLDRDGRSDIVVGSSALHSRYLRRLRGLGSGDFEAPAFLASGENPAFVDLDRDGLLDMVTSYYGRTFSALYQWTSVDVHLGRGDGTFTRLGGGTFSSYTPSPIVLGDFDGDSLTDMIVSLTGIPSYRQDAPPSRVLAYYGVGGGYFTPPQDVPLAVGVPMTAADLNGDGRDDLALGIGSHAAVYLGRADRSWTEPVSHVMTASGAIRVLSTADLNRDGRADLLASIIGPAGAPGLLASRVQRPDGTLGGADDYATTPTDALPGAIMPGDWNEDGSLDVGVWATDGAHGVLSLLANDGTGTLSYRGRRVESRINCTPAMADLSGDGHLDLVVPEDGGATIFLGRGQGEFAVPARFPTGASPVTLAVADLDENGYSDVVLNGVRGGIDWMPGGPGATMGPPRTIIDAGAQSGAAIGDFDGDGNLDVAARAPGANEIAVAYGSGDGGFSVGATVATGEGTQDFDAGDVDGDGRADLVSVRHVHLNTFPAQDHDYVVVRRGRGDRSFEPASEFDAPGSVRVLARDIEGDGRADVIVEGGNNVYLMRAQVGGVLGGPLRRLSSMRLREVADIDGDGILDLIGDGLEISSSRGSHMISPSSASGFVSAGDFDGDGTTDPAVASGNTAKFYRLITERWTLDREFLNGGSSGTMVAVDVDRDGRLDLLVLNPANATLSLLRNSGPAAVTRIRRASPLIGAVGTRVILRGTGFSTATAVTFAGVAASFRIVNDQEIAAVIPVGARSGAIAVTTPLGTILGPTFTLMPTLRSFEPAVSRVGETVTLRGWNLDLVTVASIGGAAASFSATSDSTIRLVVPRAARTGIVRIGNGNGLVESDAPLTVPPTVLGFDPERAFAGDRVRVRGYTFVDVRSVSFNGVDAVFSALSDTALEATVPPGATTGPVTVTTAAGASASRDFVVRSASELRVLGFSPNAARVGEAVAVAGANFVNVSSVAFAGIAASFEVESAERLVARVPRGASSGPIRVTGERGSEEAAGPFFVRATIDSMVPSQGVVAMAVTLSGSGFTGIESLRFGGVAASFLVVSDEVLTTRVPGGASTGVVVLEKNAIADTAGVFTVVGDNRAPVLVRFAPESAPIGGLVVLEGENLDAVSSVRFGDLAAVFEVQGAERLLAAVPRGARSGRIRLSGVLGSVESSSRFVVRATISKMRPIEGGVGTPVTLVGNGFAEVTAVLFRGVGAPFEVSGDTLIETTVPPGATTGAVTVEKPGSSDVAGNFTVKAGLPARTEVELRAAWPNPGRDQVKLGFDLPDAGATLTVYDLSGGRVRVESLSAAVHEWTWNLTDAAGRRVKPGLYVIELRSGAIKRVRRLVVL